jgi:hypothetical protein
VAARFASAGQRLSILVLKDSDDMRACCGCCWSAATGDRADAVPRTGTACMLLAHAGRSKPNMATAAADRGARR